MAENSVQGSTTRGRGFGPGRDDFNRGTPWSRSNRPARRDMDIVDRELNRYQPAFDFVQRYPEGYGGQPVRGGRRGGFARPQGGMSTDATGWGRPGAGAGTGSTSNVNTFNPTINVSGPNTNVAGGDIRDTTQTQSPSVTGGGPNTGGRDVVQTGGGAAQTGAGGGGNTVRGGGSSTISDAVDDFVGTTPVGTTPVGTDPVGTDPVGTTPVGTDPVGTTPVGTDPVGTDPVGTDPVGTDPVGTDPVGTGQTDADWLNDAYQRLLGRDVREEGSNYWLGDLAGGATRQQVEDNIKRSDEYWLNQTYNDLLGRNLGEEGRTYWGDELKGGATRQSVEDNIRRSDEYRTYQGGGVSDADFLNTTYNDILGRNVGEEGSTYWGDELAGGATRDSVRDNIGRSDEAWLNRTYNELLGRNVDEGGRTYWGDELKGGATRQSVIDNIMRSDEYTNLQGGGTGGTSSLEAAGTGTGTAGSTSNIAAASTTAGTGTNKYDDFLNQTYKSLLGRDVGEEGLNYWGGELAGGMTEKQVRDNIMASDEYRNRTYTNPDSGETYTYTMGKYAPDQMYKNDSFLPKSYSWEDHERGTGGGHSCPTPDMTILLADGSTKAAGDLEVGDEVDTLHESTLKRGTHKVSHVSIVDSPIVEANFEGKKVTCSPTHKLYSTNNSSWVAVKDLTEGDTVSLLDKGQGIVGETTFIGSTELEDGQVVKITVDEAHTYVCEGILSHNKTPLPGAMKIHGLYRDLLGRDADKEGGNYWLNELNSGRQTIEQIRDNIMRSEEYKNKPTSDKVDDFVGGTKIPAPKGDGSGVGDEDYRRIHITYAGGPEDHPSDEEHRINQKEFYDRVNSPGGLFGTGESTRITSGGVNDQRGYGHPDFTQREGPATQAFVDWVNTETGEKWSASSGAWSPKPGSGWVIDNSSVIYPDADGNLPGMDTPGGEPDPVGAIGIPYERADIENQLQGIYKDLLGREADAEGLKYWADQIHNNPDEIDPSNPYVGPRSFKNETQRVIDSIMASEEYQNRNRGGDTPPRDGRAEINRLYNDLLDRDADKEGGNYWLNELNSGNQSIEQIAENIMRSDEYQNRRGKTPDERIKERDPFPIGLFNDAYEGTSEELGITPDTSHHTVTVSTDPETGLTTGARIPVEYDSLQEYNRSKGPVQPTPQRTVSPVSNAVDNFTQQIEQPRAVGIAGNPAPVQAIEDMYQNSLGRTPDTEGLNYWTNEVNSGNMTLDQVANAIAQSPEAQGRGRTTPVEPRPPAPKPRPQPVQPRPQPVQPRPQPVQPRPQPVQPRPPAPSNPIEDMYQNFLGRDADQGGLNYWSNQVASGSMTLDQVANAIKQSPEAQTRKQMSPMAGALAGMLG